MSETIPNSPSRWTRERVALLGLICLAAGTAGGWALGGFRHAIAQAAAAPVVSRASNHGPAAADQPPSPAELKELADAQAAPLLDKLKSDPANPDLLAGLGNLYYDAQQYPSAVGYYARALRVKPADAAVRTDMGTAFWFMGNADMALEEFDKALNYAPNNPNTLFNLGLVKWKGKKDGAGAKAAWEKLLATDPNYEQKNQVQHMLAEVKTASASATK